jgi:hypothetical protein
VLPFSSFNLHDIKAGELAEASRFFGRGKFVEALNAYRAVLVKMMVVVVSSEPEANEVSKSTGDGLTAGQGDRHVVSRIHHRLDDGDGTTETRH